MSIGRVPGATGIQPSIVDAKGDLIAATAADSVSRLAVGTNNQVLTADSAEATGLKYANEARATLTTTGDLLYASAANTPARLAIGSTDQVLKVSGGIPVWGAAPSAAFSGCLAFPSAAQANANGAEVYLAFDSESFDTDSFHSTSSNNSRITVPTGKGGYYLVTAQVTFAGNATGSRVADVIKNRTTGIFRTEINNNGTNSLTFAFSGICSLVAGDYLELRTFQQSGSSININGGAGSTFLAVQFLGA